jgi:cytochrome b561
MTDVMRMSGTGQETQAYGPVARALHWTMAGGILFAFLLGLTVDAFPKAYENTVVQTHMIIGLALVVMLVLRGVSRVVSGAPAPETGGSPLLGKLAGVGHLGLYALMLVVPIAGLATIFLRGRGIELGLFTIASPVEANRALGRSAKEVHELLSFALVGLAALHAAAAVFHHVVLRDGTMRRMMPQR